MLNYILYRVCRILDMDIHTCSIYLQLSITIYIYIYMNINMHISYLRLYVFLIYTASQADACYLSPLGRIRNLVMGKVILPKLHEITRK